MSKLMLCVCGGLLAAIATPSTALASVPAWCTAPGASKVDVSDYELLKDIAPDRDYDSAIPKIVAATCWANQSVAKLRPQVDAARAQWSKRYSMTEADWADAAYYASDSYKSGLTIYVGIRNDDGSQASTTKDSWSVVPPITQYALIVYGVQMDGTYFVDALGPKLSEAGRLGYISGCVKTKNVAEAAMCLNDIQVLDRRKFYDEVRSDKLRTGTERMRMRFLMDITSTLIPGFLDRVKKWKAEDPGYAKMFAIAETAQIEWEARSKKEAALLELVFAMDDARSKTSKKAYDGCAEATFKAFQAALAKVPAKSFANENDIAEVSNTWLYKAITAVANSPEGYLASVAYYTCMRHVSSDGNGTKDSLARQMGPVLQYWPGHRGPRSTTQTAILNSGIEFDDTTKKLDVPGVNRDFFKGTGIRGSIATLGSLKPAGKETTINYAKKSEKRQECTGWKESNKIIQIRPNGELVRESWCTGYKSVTVDVTEKADLVDSRWVTSEVKPGMNLLVGHDVLMAAWPKGKPNPSVVLGVSVK